MTFTVLQQGDEIRNIHGTARCHSRYHSWKQFWIQKSDKDWPNECRIAGCTKPATDGTHVKVKGRQHYYILPTCHHCNTSKHDEWLRVNAGAIAVPVSAGDTQGDGNCHAK